MKYKSTYIRICVAMLVFFLNIAVSYAEELRTFRNSAGKEMAARILSVDSDSVRMQRASGKMFNASISMFSEADQKYIRQWAEKNIYSNKNLIEIKLKRIKGQIKTSHKGLNYTDGTFKEDAITIKKYDAYYKVELVNNTKHQLQDLRVDYLFLKRQIGRATKGKDDKGTLVGVVGSEIVQTIEPRKSSEVQTKKLSIVKYKLNIGFYTNGGDAKTQDELEGIDVRVFKDDNLITEQASPKSMAKLDWSKFAKGSSF